MYIYIHIYIYIYTNAHFTLSRSTANKSSIRSNIKQHIASGCMLKQPGPDWLRRASTGSDRLRRAPTGSDGHGERDDVLWCEHTRTMFFGAKQPNPGKARQRKRKEYRGRVRCSLVQTPTRWSLMRFNIYYPSWTLTSNKPHKTVSARN